MNLPQEQIAQYLAKYAGSFQVVGWIIKDYRHNFTTDKSKRDEWRRMGYVVMPAGMTTSSTGRVKHEAVRPPLD